MPIFAYQMHINLLKLTISAFQHYFTSYLHPHRFDAHEDGERNATGTEPSIFSIRVHYASMHLVDGGACASESVHSHPSQNSQLTYCCRAKVHAIINVIWLWVRGGTSSSSGMHLICVRIFIRKHTMYATEQIIPYVFSTDKIIWTKMIHELLPLLLLMVDSSTNNVAALLIITHNIIIFRLEPQTDVWAESVSCWGRTRCDNTMR